MVWAFSATLFLISISTLAFAQAPVLTASAQSLKSGGKAKLTIQFQEPVSAWKLACTGIDLTGWASPIPVQIDERDPHSDGYKVVSSKDFKAGMLVRLQVRRAPGTSKGESGQCTLHSELTSGPQESSISFNFR